MLIFSNAKEKLQNVEDDSRIYYIYLLVLDNLLCVFESRY